MEPTMEDRGPVLTTTEARQGSARRLNLRVLVVSMALAVVVGAMIYYAVYTNPRSAIGIPEEPAATATPGETIAPPAGP